MIYLANTEIIKQPELIQDLPQLETPVIDGVESGATVYLGTEFTVSNLPTGAKLYVNNIQQQGSTFYITPSATAINNGYNYTVSLQYKASGYVDSDVATYTLKMKNAAPTVNQNSQVTTSASLTVNISRTDTTYVSDLDVKYGVGTDTTTGNSGTSLTISDTSVNSQYNFWIAATNYADKSDVVTKYYHVVGSEKLPTPTISYDETNENFTINIASFPSDPDNGNYMSSTGYTIYYSLNSETIDTQYNNIAVSCSAGDVIRAKVSSSYGWQDSEVASYSVTVPVIELLNETFDEIQAEGDGSTDISSELDNYTDNQGWTGNKVYVAPGGGVKIGTTNVAGNITSPDISMINTDATLTVTVNAKQWSNSAGTTINNTLLVELIGSGTVDEEGANEFTLTDTAADYTVTFTNITTSTVKISITGGNRCYIYNVSAVSNEGSFEPEPEPTPEPEQYITFNPTIATGNLPTTIGSSGEGTLSGDGVDIYCDNWYIGGSQYRIQNGATVLRITGTTNFITKIEFDGVENYACSNMALSIGNGSFDDTDAPNGVYTGDGTNTSIEFVLSNRVRFTEIRVYLGDEISHGEDTVTEFWFDCEGGLERPVGEEIEVGLYFGVRDSGEEVEVQDTENCTVSSDDESVATIEWHDANEGFEGEDPLYCPLVTCVSEGECTISAEYTVNGLTYGASFPLTVTAAE